MLKLTISRLRKIIAEEVTLLAEGEKEDQAASMAQNASKLLKSIEAFKSAASAKAKSSADEMGTTLDEHLKESERVLKRIVMSPMNYVDGPKPAVQQSTPAAPTPVVASQPLPSTDSSKKTSLKPNVQKAK